MDLIVSARQLGRKKDLIGARTLSIDNIGQTPTAGELIRAVVLQQVREFNDKAGAQNLLSFLDAQSLDDQAPSGKIGFGRIYNEAKANPQGAVRTALQAFEDGLFVLFADETEYTRTDQTITLTPDTIITFIRLTFLSGGIW